MSIFFEKDSYKTVQDILDDEYDGPSYQSMSEAITERNEEISIGWVYSDGNDTKSNLIYQIGLDKKNLENYKIIWNNVE